MAMQSIGVIQHLARYPVKSMRGEPLPATPLTFQGVPEDRRYAFVQAASRSSFPWFTAREMPALLQYQTLLENAGSPEVAVTVITPEGETWPVQSDELRHALESRSGRAIFLLRDYRGSYDAAPVSVISRQTTARIAEESGTPENFWRFRPNLLVDLENGEPFDEVKWVGRTIRIGSTARIAITEPDQRCVMITLDPETSKASPNILRCVVKEHGQRAGVYGSVVTPGEVRVGDPVALED